MYLLYHRIRAIDLLLPRVFTLAKPVQPLIRAEHLSYWLLSLNLTTKIRCQHFNLTSSALPLTKKPGEPPTGEGLNATPSSSSASPSSPLW